MTRSIVMYEIDKEDAARIARAREFEARYIDKGRDVGGIGDEQGVNAIRALLRLASMFEKEADR